MSAIITVPCPGCEETLRVPSTVLGKKIKCKSCGHAFVVPDPETQTPKKSTKSAKSTKPGEGQKPVKAVAEPAPASPAPPPPAKKPSEWDDDDAQKVELISEEDVARCPHCAQELDPPDALVCIHCGFNNRTRAKATTLRTWEPDVMDWFIHLLPGLLALIVGIALITIDILVILKMREWLTGSFLESDEKDAAGRNKFYIAPGAFIFLICGFSIPMLIPCLVFAYKRLALNYRPVERLRK